MIKYWIEAMRLRTLPVSLAGVVMAIALAVYNHCFAWLPAVICLIFALLAQIASNFANEYYDYTCGRDRPGREGPRRGVTEGEISPAAMKKAIYITLGLAGCFGLSLVSWGGWWLLFPGAFIALGALAYSTGPYPLSTNGWGEVAVVCFFGIVPVNLTYYVQSLQWSPMVLSVSVAIGLMGANVLVVNNYRDCHEDACVGKRTLCVRLGRRCGLWLYGLCSVGAFACLFPLNVTVHGGWWISTVYLAASLLIILKMSRSEGRKLNPLLGITAMLMALVAVAYLLIISLGHQAI